MDVSFEPYTLLLSRIREMENVVTPCIDAAGRIMRLAILVQQRGTPRPYIISIKFYTASLHLGIIFTIKLTTEPNCKVWNYISGGYERGNMVGKVDKLLYR